MMNLIDERIAKAANLLEEFYKHKNWQWYRHGSSSNDMEWYVPTAADIALTIRSLYEEIKDKEEGFRSSTGRLHVEKVEDGFEIHLEILND